ncbi:MAG: rhodanese-like domain-containing protein [Planctomycetota bacterium]
MFAVCTAGAVLGGCTRNVDEGDIRSAALTDIRSVVSGTAPGTLVDARSPSRFRSGHLPGAENLQLLDVPLDRSPPLRLVESPRIIVYGQNEGDPFASGLTLRLLEVGLDQTRLYRGGLDEWVQAAGELEEDEPPAN